ncbi:MAG: methionyl-tRNA formyltransferase [Anaerolineales bacterium]
MPRIVFMGSPDFALPTLRALAAHYTVVGVVTQPDRAAGRGRKLTPPPVKTLAQELGIPLIQPVRLKEAAAWEQLQTWQPDVIVVAAFGQILRQNVLDLPRFGCINVHASLLPRWRGAAPIQAAILAGDSETGVTIMQMDAGLDTGAMLRKQAVAIGEHETGGELFNRLAQLGADLLLQTLPDYLDGKITPQPQENALATYAPRLEKSSGLLNFALPAVELARQVRAFNPWPGAFTLWEGNPLKIHRAHAAPAPLPLEAGTPVTVDNLPGFAASPGILVLDEVQLPGKKAIAAADFLRGVRTWGDA